VSGSRPESLHHATLDAGDLRLLRKRLVGLELARRIKLPGVDRRRADILPAGAVVLDTILSRLGVKELMLCEWALREGILLDYASRQKTLLARAEAYPDVRRRSVLLLAERCQADATHARHVARLALELFDATRSVHKLAGADRDLLEYASLLHDVGHHISHTQHHKHSYYLVKNGDLRGFTPAEIETMANVARYHRGADPSKKHAGFASLSRDDRGRVLVLAGLLRFAEALDRSHRQRVRGVQRARGAGVRLRLRVVGDAQLELWGANRHVELLQGALGVPMRVESAGERRGTGTRRAVARSA
jgi:exopolyphosphatase/guanosine-5'-triphosphate,3'-diphosphate pyrophosphatase